MTIKKFTEELQKQFMHSNVILSFNEGPRITDLGFSRHGLSLYAENDDSRGVTVNRMLTYCHKIMKYRSDLSVRVVFDNEEYLINHINCLSHWPDTPIMISLTC